MKLSDIKELGKSTVHFVVRTPEEVKFIIPLLYKEGYLKDHVGNSIEDRISGTHKYIERTGYDIFSVSGNGSFLHGYRHTPIGVPEIEVSSITLFESKVLLENIKNSTKGIHRY